MERLRRRAFADPGLIETRLDAAVQRSFRRLQDRVPEALRQLDEELDSLKARHRWLDVDADVDLEPLEPLDETKLGRRLRVLVSRWDEAAARRLIGGEPEVSAASLEEIVVAWASRRPSTRRGDAAP